MAEDRERNRLSGRLGRYARVGSSMGGIGARLAGERLLGRKTDSAALAVELRRVLGELRGPVMKVAQILSAIPDALPPEFAAELSQLQAAAPAMGRAFVRRRMAGELGPGWRDRFAEFELEAAAAASLGQVHRARHHDGRELAVKLQYPGMSSTLEADLNQLDLLLGLFRRYDGSIDTGLIREELAERLREEIDYRRELAHMRLFRLMLADEPGVRVPEPVEDLSTGRLLAMTWLEGRPLVEFADAPQAVRDRLAMHLFHAWYRPFHQFGVIHGDPHPGNYSATPEQELNLLDFGCVRIFRPDFVGAVIDLHRALERGDEALAVQAYEVWGFRGLSRELVETLNLWASFLYAPLLEDATRLIHGGETPGRYGAEVAARVHKRLRELGPVTPPREFVLVDRAAIGLGSVFMRLGAELNWHRLFAGLIEDFSVEALATRQREALKRAGVNGLNCPSGGDSPAPSPR